MSKSHLGYQKKFLKKKVRRAENGKLPIEEVQHLRRLGVTINFTNNKRPIRRFAAWWETTAVEKFLEDVEFLLKNAAVLNIINLVASVTIIISLITWLATEKQGRDAEIYQAWQVITNAHEQSGSGGRIEALEFLNSEPRRVPWFWIKWKKQSLAGLAAPKAYLVEIELQEADLGSANLEQADLGSANLEQADLGSANLEQADLGSANLSQADLSEANLEKAVLRLANLEKAVLLKANLSQADLGSANLEQADLWLANLEKADLGRANLHQAYLSDANLQEANLGRTHLEEADLSEANLKKADLSEANLQQTKLWLADLQEAKLWLANLQEADLSGANLQEANLRRANLEKADLLKANLSQAKLWLANLEEAVLVETTNLTREQIKSTCNWDKVIYKGEWNEEKKTYVAKEPDNKNYIEELKKDKSSDPKEPHDCSIWNNP
ncbi:MAG: pentapeptide repeat-containing protein [Xenococcaceae cyanobacterium MO_207.B15]|nr:pentapeptide repeat-containing protein [Xenococcaceae cyanobacterium MO_207.B15]